MGDDAPRPKYIIANSDEMEPGAFKDRLLMEGNPHQLIEGLIIGGYAIQADRAYVFLRWEYNRSAERIGRAIEEAYRQGYLGKNILGSGYSLEMRLHVSAGRYICGEETALLQRTGGQERHPALQAPFPQLSGLWGKPAIVNNAETLSNLPHIIANGAAWFRGLSRCDDGGTKIYGVSGRVKQPGSWELPMGTPIREILEEHAGGMKEGFSLRAIIPGGASTEFLLPEHLDVNMDYDSCQKAGSRLGTGTMIVLDDRTCPVGMVHNLIVFLPASPAGGAPPAGRGSRGWRRFSGPSKRVMGKAAIWKSSQPTPVFWGRGTPSAPWRPAPWSRFRAPQLFSRGLRAAHPREEMPLEVNGGNHLHR